MDPITALFWDVGGVILTNGWDRHSRRQAAEQFGLDREEFEDRHELIMAAFETGEVKLEQYLDRTVFYRSRSFSKEAFKEFMLAQSQPDPETLDLLGELARLKKYLLATLNNESLELNLYRIERFGLRRCFDAFFSSCFLGVRKPDERIYQTALRVTQRSPGECVFIDDRDLNLECARKLGMVTVHYQNPAQLRQELHRFGVEVKAG